ncbi:alkene reductase [Azospirillum sp. A26]|uniref:alkene reductase n=1 Tax=Azospirillum sp. A26 TaxID=3160607 RepID=UPI0036712E19
MSDTKATDLFTPTSIGAIAVSNRIAMAPLTRSRAGMDGVHSPLAVDYYRQRASAGLIITEATNISRQGRGYAYTPGIYTEAHVEAWRAVTEAVHGEGGKIVLQLWHVGRVSHSSLQENDAAPVAPSAIRGGGRVYTLAGDDVPSMPRALETDEIPGLVEDYRHAARLAMEAGFDGVEVHAANGYLLDQFLRDSTNVRTDIYGGSIENRARFPIEVVKAVAGLWGGDRVGVRLSPLSTAIGETPLDSDPQATYGHFVQQIGTLGLAYLHCVEGQLRQENASSAFDFKALHKAFGGSYIANNGYDRQMAMNAITSGHADMISFGRAFIGNPDLVERLGRNAPLFDAPPSAYYGGGAEGYTDFASLAD